MHKPQIRQWLGDLINRLLIAGSAVLCTLLLMARIPGMELVEIGPNWVLIWVVSWSLRRSVWQGAIAGCALGLLQDSITAPWPSHVFGLMLAGIITALIHQQRYLQEDFIGVILLCFAMAILVEAVMALQYSLTGERSLSDIWDDFQRIALASAILSSLWAPVLYYPLQHCWQIGRKVSRGD